VNAARDGQDGTVATPDDFSGKYSRRWQRGLELLPGIRQHPAVLGQRAVRRGSIRGCFVKVGCEYNYINLQSSENYKGQWFSGYRG
jgi:hypothetical protein